MNTVQRLCRGCGHTAAGHGPYGCQVIVWKNFSGLRRGAGREKCSCIYFQDDYTRPIHNHNDQEDQP